MMTVAIILAFIAVLVIGFFLLRRLAGLAVWMILIAFIVFLGFYLFLRSAYFPFDLPLVVEGAMTIVEIPFTLMGEVLRNTVRFMADIF